MSIGGCIEGQRSLREAFWLGCGIEKRVRAVPIRSPFCEPCAGAPANVRAYGGRLGAWASAGARQVRKPPRLAPCADECTSDRSGSALAATQRNSILSAAPLLTNLGIMTSAVPPCSRTLSKHVLLHALEVPPIICAAPDLRFRSAILCTTSRERTKPLLAGASRGTCGQAYPR